MPSVQLNEHRPNTEIDAFDRTDPIVIASKLRTTPHKRGVRWRCPLGKRTVPLLGENILV